MYPTWVNPIVLEDLKLGFMFLVAKCVLYLWVFCVLLGPARSVVDELSSFDLVFAEQGNYSVCLTYLIWLSV